MLRPVLRHFDFEYREGYQFWDKAGRVARDLVQAIPGLQLRNQLIDQRDFFTPDNTLELYFGIRVATLHSFREDAVEFRKQASLLMEILNEELELQTMTRFRFQLALGWPCQTREEAYALTMKLLPPQVGHEVKSGEFQAAQIEVQKGALLITTRYAILDVSPPPGPARLESSSRVPHFVYSVLGNNLEERSIRDFRTAETLEEMENDISSDILKRINATFDVKPN